MVNSGIQPGGRSQRGLLRAKAGPGLGSCRVEAVGLGTGEGLQTWPLELKASEAKPSGHGHGAGQQTEGAGICPEGEGPADPGGRRGCRGLERWPHPVG